MFDMTLLRRLFCAKPPLRHADGPSTGPLAPRGGTKDPILPGVRTQPQQSVVTTTGSGANTATAKVQPNNSLRLFALIITINMYQHADIPNLSGSINDGDNFQEFLTGSLGVSQHRIRRLSNGDATRANILHAFKTHLIDNDDIREGDAMVFFYAGHGSRVEAHPRWLVQDDFVETIVPYDEGATDPDWGHIYGIPDRTFDGLMRQLASRRGNNITAIFDSCHSGGIARGALQDFTPRVLLANVSPPPLPERLDADIWQWGLAARSATTVVPTGFLYKAMTSHVLFAACRQEELAYESREKPFRGAFTAALMDALRSQSLGVLSYERLAELLKLRGVENQQHPQCEGANKNRVLFNASDLVDRSHSFQVTRREADGRLVLDAGGIHGIVEGTELVVENQDGVHNELARDVTFVATSVQALKSILVPKQPVTAPAGLTDFRVTVANWNAPTVTVRLLCPTRSLHCSVVEPNRHSDISVYCGNGELETTRMQLERHDPLVTKYCATRRLEFPYRDLASVLDGVARFNVHLYRRNPHTPIKGSFDVQLHQLQVQPDTGLRPTLNAVGEDFFAEPAEDMICTEGSSCQVDSVKHAVLTNIEAYYGLTLINTSHLDLFPYVFYFYPNDYSVQAWYLPPSRTMSAPLPGRKEGNSSTSLQVGFGTAGTDSFEFSIPDGSKADTGFLKVLLSTSYVDMGHIAQEAVIGSSATRGGKKTRNLDVFEDAWDEWTGILTCQRVSESSS